MNAFCLLRFLPSAEAAADPGAKGKNIQRSHEWNNMLTCLLIALRGRLPEYVPTIYAGADNAMATMRVVVVALNDAAGEIISPSF